MIDTQNTESREVMTPDGKGTLVQYITNDDQIVGAFVKIAGEKFFKKFDIEELEEIDG